jgi:hypothetical protein
LRHYATSHKVAGSVPDEVVEFFFNLPNPSHTMALGLTQHLTEMSIRKSLREVKLSWCLRLKASLSSVGRVSRKCGSLDMSQPYGPPTGISLLFTFTAYSEYGNFKMSLKKN